MTQHKMLLVSEFGGELYLGDIGEDQIRAVEAAFIDVGVDVCIGSVDRRIRTVANPLNFTALSEGRVKDQDLKKWLRSALKAPFQAMSEKRRLLSSEVTIGATFGSAVQYPITKRELEGVSLEEAAVNLALFFKSTRDMMSAEMLESLDTFNYIDVASLRRSKTGKALKDLNNLVKKLTTQFVDSLIDKNTKMKKSKLPSAMGIGTPSDVEGWNYGPSDGSEGLQFMPNHTLVKYQAQAGQRSFLQIMEELPVDLMSLGDANADLILKEKAIQTLYALNNRQTASCCAFSSVYCELVCLADGNQRNATRKDVLGRDFEDRTRREDDDASYNRMALGCRQTAFLANPYYFLRCLISAIEKRSANYAKGLDKYTEKVIKESNALKSEQRRARTAINKLNKKPSLSRKEEKTYKDLEQVLREIPEEPFTEAAKRDFIKRVPPSVRLNVLSDYVWELICPDLFHIFNGRSTFDGRKLPKIQFYDYTKISGRWAHEDRVDVADYIGVPQDAYEYPLPENYHITFSFAGTKKSLQDAECAALAGQNITFAFDTTSFSASSFATLFHPQFAAYRSVFASESKPTKSMSDAGFEAYALAQELTLLERLREFREMVFKALSSADLKGLIPKKLPTKLTIDTLPSVHMGYEVLNGDWSDLRFLDDYQKSDPTRAAVVGLKWKIPYGSRFDVPGLAQWRYDTASANEKAKVDAYLAAAEDDRAFGLRQTTMKRPPGPYFQYLPSSASLYPSRGRSQKSQDAGAAFAQLRLSLDIALQDGLGESVTLYIIPKSGDFKSSAEAIRGMYRGAARQDMQEFTFVTESGNLVNTTQQLSLQAALDALAGDEL
jgi:hypothetical protein